MDAAVRVAVITGASSGIGASTAQTLARVGFIPVLGARRVDRLAEIAIQPESLALHLDVTDPASVSAFVGSIDQRFGRIDVLVNNAGMAKRATAVDATPDADWAAMWQANVLGLLRMTRECLPLMRRTPLGHIVNVGSVSGFEVYEGGAGYTATKWAVRAITRTLRLELLGEPIRVTEIDPGMTQTEFMLSRLDGDAEETAKTYLGVKPLAAADIAACISFVVTQPAHVNIDEMVITPVQQGAPQRFARDSELARKLGG
jgi:3-hydroxy acid dehydrogenase/malonic semialdehyde reductase